MDVAQERRDLFISRLEKQTNLLTINHSPFRSLYIIAAHVNKDIDESKAIAILNQNDILGDSPVPPPILLRKVDEMAKLINTLG